MKSFIGNKPKMNQITVIKNKRDTKDILPSAFFIMKCVGLWEPYESNSVFKKAYTAYTIVVMLIMITVGISLVCFILFTTENIRDVFFENSFLLFTLFNSWIKATILLWRRKDIKSLLKVLLEDQCQPLDSVEQDIQKQFDEQAR